MVKYKNTAMVQYHLNKQGQAKIDVIPMVIKAGTPTPTDNPWRMKRIYNDLNKFSSNPELLEKERNKFELNLDHSRIIKHAEERKKKEAQAN